ncbi:MAG: helix-turn-helix transcriptional regulator [Pseudomonadota bacterium]
MAISYTNQAIFHAMSVRKILTPSGMPPIGPKLKELRLRAKPKLSIRKIADALEIPHASYQFYEREDGYKKSLLPLDFARRVATVLAKYGVDPADVMALAGLTESEAKPEAREIEALRPTAQFAVMTVALPSEAALTDMFESLLSLIPPEATRAEAAQILARRLPSGFAACGPLSLDQLTAPMPAASATAQSPARDHRALGPMSRS